VLEEDENDTSPQDHVMKIIRSQGMLEVEMRESLSIMGFFSEYAEEEMAAYDADVLKAIRSQDIEKFRKFHASGRPLKFSNTFGENLLHTWPAVVVSSRSPPPSSFMKPTCLFV
jgi:hypothetical protein